MARLCDGVKLVRVSNGVVHAAVPRVRLADQNDRLAEVKRPLHLHRSDLSSLSLVSP